jgi:hypothetical protein
LPRSAHGSAACAATWGWARSGLPPFVAFRRRALATSALLACVVVGSACGSSGGSAARPTVSSTALAIPPPFEVGQQVGLGDVTIVVASFRRQSGVVSVDVEVANDGSHAVTVVPANDFAVFYGSGLHAPTSASGIAPPIAPHARATATLEFRVPDEFGYPLVWFKGSVSGTHSGTVVLRGNGS